MVDGVSVARDAVETRSFNIEGMTCAACAARIERVLRKTPGVADARVNLALERADVAAIEGCEAETIIAAVERAGFTAELRAGDPVLARQQREAREAQERVRHRRTLVIVAVSAALSLPFLAAMAAMALGLAWELAPLTQFVLASGVQVLAGTRFYRGAFNSLRGGSANMDVLVAVGTSAAYGFSVYQLIALGSMAAMGHLYFEASALVLTLVMLGKLLEERAKASTTRAVRALMALRPETARRISPSGAVELVPVTAILPGDRVQILPGERVPVDGTVNEGASSCDESVISGESLPVLRKAGDKVVTGAMNGEGALTVSVDAVGEDSTLGKITRLVENAQSGKAPLQRLVDRISAIFVPTVVGVAVLTFVLWMASGHGFEPAMAAAVAVLVIACPCALGLATPTALVAGTGAAARSGILIKDIEALERAARVSAVVFDKTGTLTEGRPELVSTVLAAGTEEAELLTLAASAQTGSEHPLGRAVIRRAEALGLTVSPASAVTALPGRGIEATVQGVNVLVGTANLMASRGIDLGDLGAAEDALTVAFVAADGRLIGRLGFADRLRDTALAAVRELKARGIRTLMLTGDNGAVAAVVAGQLGLDSWRAGILPDGKSSEVVALRASGERVAMVGDGVNDAPALAAADVGIAMGSGTDVAMETAAITLMRPDPRLVGAALDVARATSLKIRQNLFWAFVYNVVGIPLAAFGLLTPALAGAAMAMSSVSVVSNAGLLTRWKPRLP
ncbi:heavy metal translocating P-type ATPase [Oryzibacter oryziterrae]|uniref:heavy metal translocating P-type ATPase n=1 Tax=Oryzibacter oryziterrae TaxID=2766474 RepID=UPI001F02D7C7|nr:heavy metal translocating P-type ATPase [Oryzibacter oryziterrae]